jgi:hypothetical protein
MCPWPQPCRRPQVGEANPRQKWKTLPKTITKRAGGRTPALQLGFELSSNPSKNEKKKKYKENLWSVELTFQGKETVKKQNH